MLPRLRSIWRVVRTRSRFERDMDDELRFHLDRRVEDLVRGGMPEDRARRVARIEFGNPEALQDRCRESRGMGPIDALRTDFRYAWRAVRKNALLSATVVATLALGIGANTAMFSVLHSILTPVSYPDADRLAFLNCRITFPDHRTSSMGWSYPKLQDLRGALTAFASVAAAAGLDVNLTAPGAAERIRAEIVSGNYFETLGVHPHAGSLRLPDDRDAAPAVVLSESLWRRRFGADATTIGRIVELNRTPFTVVGIAPGSFIGETGRSDVWVPLSAAPIVVLNNPRRLEQRMAHWLTVVGRLAPGVNLDRADQDLKRAVRNMEQAAPSSPSSDPSGLIWDGTVTSLVEAKIDPTVRRSLTVLVAAVGCVLLIACLNLASVLTSRAVGRRREIAIRLAIGATRSTIVRQLLAESAVLTAMGGVFGFLFASWGLEILAALGFDVPAVPGAPFVRNVDLSLVTLDTPIVIAYAALITATAGLLFGLVPALLASNLSIAEALKGPRTGWRPARRSGDAPALRRALLIAQVALVVVLLSSAGVMLRTFDRLQSTRTGVEHEHLLTFRLDLPPRSYAPEQAALFLARLGDDLRALPGVRSVAVANGLPLQGQNERTKASIDDVELSGEAGVHMVDASYFDALRIPLLRGRLLSDQDGTSSPRVALISDTAARRYLPSGDPIGRKLTLGLNGWNGADSPTIVGIVGDVKYQLLTMPFGSEVYVSARQRPPQRAFFVVRSDQSTEPLANAIRTRVGALDRTLPIYAVRTMREIVAGTTAAARFTSLLLTVFAIAALLLACVGLYGTLAYSVSTRTREIGVRMALGAEPGRVRRFVGREVAVVAAAGLAIGLAGAGLAGRVVAQLLYQVDPVDPLVLAIVSVVLIGSAFLAGVLPARRAARIDPMVALRDE
jgi:putative ABC transport system permease protein